MRSVASIIIVAVVSAGLAGCRSDVSPTSPPRPTGPTASALAFTPPIAFANPPLDLSRDDRAVGAFVGYESEQVTYYYVRQDDRFRSTIGGGRGWDVPSSFERRAVSTTVGVRVR